MPTSTEIDKQNIDELIKQFFGLFNNKGTSRPDWDLIFRICIPETMIIKKNGLAQTIYNLKDFIEPRKTILTDGTLTDFEETEIEEQTSIANNIAQRKSRYQKNGYLKNQYFSELGTKLFHLIRTTAGWKISSVTWEDDRI
jgi:hypothetical protein